MQVGGPSVGLVVERHRERAGARTGAEAPLLAVGLVAEQGVTDPAALPLSFSSPDFL